MREYAPFIITGILLGIAPAFATVFLFALAVSAWVLRWFPPAERRFVVTVFLVGLSLRYLLTLIFHLFSLSHGNGGIVSFIGGDSIGYSGAALTLSKIIQGHATLPMPIYIGDVYRGILSNWDFSFYQNVYSYLLTSIYFLFDYSPLAAKFMNCFFNSMAGVIVYAIAKRIYTVRIAKISMLFFMFFPTLIIWSTENLKDSLFLMLTLLSLWSLLQFQTNRRKIYLALLFLIVALLIGIRLKTFVKFFVIVSAVSAVLFYATVILKNNLKRLAVTGIIIAALLLGIGIQRKIDIYAHIKPFVIKSMTTHIGHITTGGTNYKLFPDSFYTRSDALDNITPRDTARYLIKSSFYFLLVPFPWDVETRHQLLFLPQTLLWYIYLCLAVIGTAYSLNKHRRDSLSLILYVLAVTFCLGASSGNIGTVIRHRDLISPIIFILSAVGINVLMFNNAALKPSTPAHESPGT